MASLPVLVLNSGSSSIKFSMYEAGDNKRERIFEGAVDGIGTEQGKFWIKNAEGVKFVDEERDIPSRSVAFRLVADYLNSGKVAAPKAIGHRTVCGGPTVTENQPITEELIKEIEGYSDFAPLHTPIGVYIMRQAIKLFPGVPNFAVLDTYFHRTMPEISKQLPIPCEYTNMGVRRFGYHGISYESIVMQLEQEGKVPENLIVCHLGNGASISAIKNGQCVDTAMGLTPSGGIISGTRTGDIDPGVVLFMLRKIAKDVPNSLDAAEQLDVLVSKKAGLLGVSELSNDMRDLRNAINAGNAKARLSVSKFNSTIAKWVGGFISVLGGLDMVVFTGGIGENDCDARGEICDLLAPFGVKTDKEQNKKRGKVTVSTPDSKVAVRVIPPLEDLIIVNHVVRMLGSK